MATQQRPMGMQSLHALSAGKRGTLCVYIRAQQSDRWSHSLKIALGSRGVSGFQRLQACRSDINSSAGRAPEMPRCIL